MVTPAAVASRSRSGREAAATGVVTLRRSRQSLVRDYLLAQTLNFILLCLLEPIRFPLNKTRRQVLTIVNR
jgi:hypothetical protein